MVAHDEQSRAIGEHPIARMREFKLNFSVVSRALTPYHVRSPSVSLVDVR
jgi:hypothetical protein